MQTVISFSSKLTTWQAKHHRQTEYILEKSEFVAQSRI